MNCDQYWIYPHKKQDAQVALVFHNFRFTLQHTDNPSPMDPVWWCLAKTHYLQCLVSITLKPQNFIPFAALAFIGLLLAKWALRSKISSPTTCWCNGDHDNRFILSFLPFSRCLTLKRDLIFLFWCFDYIKVATLVFQLYMGGNPNAPAVYGVEFLFLCQFRVWA